MSSLRLAFALAAALHVGACAGDVNPVRDAAVGLGVGVKPKEAPDFVAQSRPGAVDYRPLGIAPPPRERLAKSKNEVAEVEKAMDSERDALAKKAEEARRLGATPPASAPKPVP